MIGIPAVQGELQWAPGEMRQEAQGSGGVGFNMFQRSEYHIMVLEYMGICENIYIYMEYDECVGLLRLMRTHEN